MREARLPDHYDPATVDADEHGPWLTAHLLEDGDTTDLRWLVGRFGAQRLRRWVLERGGRQLSVRSLALWRLVLDVEVEVDSRGRALWQR